MNSQYINLVRELPPPTDEQIALFATFVSQAHSWYKHLPVSARVPFYFYLDPNVGRIIDYNEKGAKIRDYNGGGIHYPSQTTGGGIHYTSQTTKEWCRCFGFLAYHHDRDNRLPIFPQTIPETGVPSKVILSVYDSQVKPHVVPPALVDLGKAYLSAFVHPDSNFGILETHLKHELRQFGMGPVLEHESANLVNITSELFRNIWFILQKLQADFPITHNPVVKGEIPSILKSFRSSSYPNYAEIQQKIENQKERRKAQRRKAQKMTEPVQKTREFLEALWAELENWQPSWSWMSDEWLAEQTKALGGTTTFVALLQALEIARTSANMYIHFGYCRINWQKVSPDFPDFIADFHHAFVSERIRQLEDMKQAMYRFVEAVYHPHAPVTYLVPPADQEKCTLQHEKEVLSQKVAIQKWRAMCYEQGKQHYLARHYQEALVSFEQVLRYRSDFSPALYRIACIYALQGEVKPAVAYLQKAIVLRADYRELARITQAFDKIRQNEIFQNLVAN